MHTSSAVGLAAVLVLTGGTVSAAAPTADAFASMARPSGALLTVTGRTSGTGTFTLARDTRIELRADDPGSDQVDIRGDGRAVGLVARRTGAGPPVTFAAFLANACFSRACRPDRIRQPPFTLITGSRIEPGAQGPASLVLPAGTYRTSLMTDGAPVTVRLALTGLSKSQTLRPTAPAAVRYTDVPQQSDPAPAHLAATGGRSYRFRSPGFVLTQTASTTAAGGQQFEGDCIILGQAPPAGVYAPGCPTAEPADERFAPLVSQGTAPGDLSSQQLGGVSLTGVPAAPIVSVGNWVVSVVPLLRSRAVHLTVELP